MYMSAKYKTSKNIEKIKYLNKLRVIPCSWIGRVNISKMSIFIKFSCISNAIPMKILEFSLCVYVFIV